MSYITAIGTSVPSNKLDQTTIASFMEQVMDLDDQSRRKLRAIFRASGIDYRYSVLGDYGRTSEFTFYPNPPSKTFPSTESRMRVFRDCALPLSLQAVHAMQSTLDNFNLSSVTHLIVVCCTGMYAPGLDIDLVKSLSLNTTVQRTSITFMGCYAAFNALKAANAYCMADAAAKVLIVCTELCSLHFQHTMSDDNLLANTLFADGSAAMLVEGSTTRSTRLSLESFHSDLALDGEYDMAWSIGDLGFEMKLTAYIPAIIKGGIRTLTDALLRENSISLDRVRYFALHPGGVKILEAIEQALSIPREKNAFSYRVLRNFGNMSSPTVVFVLREIFNSISRQDDQLPILSLAFGPGLTLESMILKIEVD